MFIFYEEYITYTILISFFLDFIDEKILEEYQQHMKAVDLCDLWYVTIWLVTYYIISLENSGKGLIIFDDGVSKQRIHHSKGHPSRHYQRSMAELHDYWGDRQWLDWGYKSYQRTDIGWL